MRDKVFGQNIWLQEDYFTKLRPRSDLLLPDKALEAVEYFHLRSPNNRVHSLPAMFQQFAGSYEGSTPTDASSSAMHPRNST